MCGITIYFNGFSAVFSMVFPMVFSSQATFWPMKLHRVVVVRASDWEAPGSDMGMGQKPGTMGKP